jgi:hypothetical protein
MKDFMPYLQLDTPYSYSVEQKQELAKQIGEIALISPTCKQSRLISRGETFPEQESCGR